MFTFKVMQPTPGFSDQDWTVVEGAAYTVGDDGGMRRVIRIMSEPPFTADTSDPQQPADVLHSIVLFGPVYVMNADGKTIDTIRPILPSVAADPHAT